MSRHTYGDDVRNLKDSAKTTVRGGVSSFTALRRLAAAELNLSRHAAGRSVVWLAVAIVFGASFWLLLMAGTVVLMHDKLGWSWLVCFWVAALVSLLITLVGALRVRHYFGFTGLKSTKLELARFGIGEEDDDEPDAKPSFSYLQNRVARAGLVAEGRREQALSAYATMRQQARDVVTPGRVLAAGAVSGYLVGRRGRGESDEVVMGRFQRTGIAARSALYTTDTALRGLSELASLAASTFAAFKAKDAAEAVDTVSEPPRAASWDPEDPLR